MVTDRISGDMSNIAAEIEPFVRTKEDSQFLLSLLQSIQFLKGNSPLQSVILKMLGELQKESR